MNSGHDTVAAVDVVGTIHLSLANARRCGDPWKSLAEEYLGATEKLLLKTESMMRDVIACHGVAKQAETEMKDAILLLLESVADALWEHSKNEPIDALMNIISPDTPSFLFHWEIGQPTDRLEILLGLLSKDTVPSLEGDTSIQEIMAILPEFHARCEASRKYRAQAAVLEKAMSSIARAGHVQHSRLRKRMRADGFDPFKVREVLPDVPGQSMSSTFG